MIQVQELSKAYGDLLVVEKLSFKLMPGEILGFLGANGAGKSTTMKMLTGFLAPTSGGISIWGHSLPEETMQAQSHIGYLPEGAPCYEEMTPAGFLAFIAAVRGYYGKEARVAVERAVDTMSLGGVLYQKIETLSKGFKRRVGLAQAILHEPDILILDEPTDGLDPNQKHQVREMIKGLSKEKIVIISTHILEEVSAVCNRVMILAAGKIVSDSTPAELLAKSSFRGAVSLSFQDEQLPDAAVTLLSGLKGVNNVTRTAEGLLIFPVPGQPNLLPDIYELSSAHGWQTSSIYVEQGKLDDVFRSLTEEAEATCQQ